MNPGFAVGVKTLALTATEPASSGFTERSVLESKLDEVVDLQAINVILTRTIAQNRFELKMNDFLRFISHQEVISPHDIVQVVSNNSSYLGKYQNYFFSIERVSGLMLSNSYSLKSSAAEFRQ